MKLLVRTTAIFVVLILMQYGNACSSSFSNNESLSTVGAFSCVSDESTYQNLGLTPLKVGYLGNKKVTYKSRPDGSIIVDGDLIFNTAGDLPTTPPSNLIVNRGVGVNMGTGQTWPGGVIPYQISSNLPNAQRVTDAVNHWNSNLQGVIQFVPRTTQTDYAYFVPIASGCSSTIGYQAGKGAHPVELSNDCGSGNVAHEMGHIVGLDHEQNRLDRDSFITINWGSVLAGFEANFQVNLGERNYLAYDFGSIMHYGLFAFSKDGNQTMSPKATAQIPANTFVGQRAGLSLGDINSVRTMYGAAPITAGVDANGLPVTPAGSGLQVTNGLLARYFADAAFTDLRAQRIEPVLSQNWGGSPPLALPSAGTFSVRWTGYLVPPEAGDYSFTVKGTDGVRVRISDTNVVALDGTTNMPKESVSINYTLSPSQRYVIIVDYFKTVLGDSSMNILWKRPSGILETIPASALIPDPNDSIRAPCNPSW